MDAINGYLSGFCPSVFTNWLIGYSLHEARVCVCVCARPYFDCILNHVKPLRRFLDGAFGVVKCPYESRSELPLASHNEPAITP